MFFQYLQAKIKRKGTFYGKWLFIEKFDNENIILLTSKQQKVIFKLTDIEQIK